jgi:hypothetical protein
VGQTSDTTQPIRPGWTLALMAVAALVMGALPFWGILGHWPWGADATKWVGNALATSSGWGQWVLGTRHFIGYRPVTAFTFVVNDGLLDAGPVAYRAFDISLHMLAGVLVYLLFRSLTGIRGWWAFGAMALFYAHPAVETVVPYVSRRSYTLAMVFGTAGLVLFLGTMRQQGKLRFALGAGSFVSLLLALLSNEIAFVVLPLLPALVWLERAHWKQGALLVAPIAVMATAVVAVRTSIIGTLGGYERKYVAYAEHGVNRLKDVKDPKEFDIVGAAWSYLCFPTGASGQDALLPGSILGTVAAEVVFLYYAWRVVLEPARRIKERSALAILILSAWLFGYSLLYALTGTWFWRQGYPMLLPASVLFVFVLADTLKWKLPLPARVLHLLPQGLCLASVLYHSPVLFGLDEEPFEVRAHGSAVVNEIARDVERVARGGVVYLALPAKKQKAHIVRIWLSKVVTRRRGMSFKILALMGPTGKRQDDLVTASVAVAPRGGMEVTLNDGMIWSDVQEKALGLKRPERAWLDKLSEPRHPTYLYTFEGAEGTLRPVPPKQPKEPRQRRQKVAP